VSIYWWSIGNGEGNEYLGYVKITSEQLYVLDKPTRCCG